MQTYKFKLDLRIWHPDLDPEEISKTLNFQPDTFWKNGDAKKTPTGSLLQGMHSETYWASNPFSNGWRYSTEALIEEAINELITYLDKYIEFLQEISQEGIIRLWISSHSKSNFSIEIPPRMSAKFSELGLTFIHDAYQVPQNDPKENHYPISIVFNNQSYYLVWISDENDSLLKTEKGDILVSKSYPELKEFTDENLIYISDSDLVIYDFDKIKSWIFTPKIENIKCDEFLDFWNLKTDFLFTIKQEPEENEEAHLIYEKLFEGCNLPALAQKNQMKSLTWNTNEIQELIKVLNDGLSAFDRGLKFNGKI